MVAPVPEVIDQRGTGRLGRSFQQRLHRITADEPAPIFRNADGDDVVTFPIDGVHHALGGHKRHFVLAGTTAEHDSDSQLAHGHHS